VSVSVSDVTAAGKQKVSASFTLLIQ